MRFKNIVLTTLTLLIVPFAVSSIASFTTWFGTRARAEVTLALEGFITVGSLQEGDVPGLALTWDDRRIKNALKLSWRIENSGTKGIPSFEHGPLLSYPEEVTVVTAKISRRSDQLRVAQELTLDSARRQIGIEGLGIFNRGDFLIVEVYVIDAPESATSGDSLARWTLRVKALDLHVREDLASFQRKPPVPSNERTRLYFLGVLAGFVSALAAKIVYERTRSSNSGKTP